MASSSNVPSFADLGESLSSSSLSSAWESFSKSSAGLRISSLISIRISEERRLRKNRLNSQRYFDKSAVPSKKNYHGYDKVACILFLEIVETDPKNKGNP